MAPCIWCTNHLCDSYSLTDINLHFVPSLFPMISKCKQLLTWLNYCNFIDTSWTLEIVMSQWPIFPTWYLWCFFYHNCVEVNEFVKYSSVQKFSSNFITERICGAVNKSFGDVIINWPRAMHTVWMILIAFIILQWQGNMRTMHSFSTDLIRKLGIRQSDW